MTSAVIRDGAYALKVFRDGNIADIAKLVRLTARLRNSGVPIPETRRETDSNAIRLPWINGETMRERMRARGFDDFNAANDDLVAAMGVLSRLHVSKAPRKCLSVFDPFRLSDKRMAEPLFQALPRTTRMDARRLRALLDMRKPATSPGVTIHGDFHLGQLILEKQSNKWWLIDLDDAALGHIEADIANFCINVATRRHQPSACLLKDLKELLAICVSAYKADTNTELLGYYAACAFLRRALKFAARGENLDRVSALLSAGHFIA